jgi:gamma-glutamylcyclotransferase (GGCT)/AIG2-like uncharacterized protein YtfP
LKRGCSNHGRLISQQFVGPARTSAGHRLYDFGGFPGIVATPDDHDGVVGEVWSVDQEALVELDEFEGVHEGMYRREPVELLAPFAGQVVHAYVSGLPPAGRIDLGSEWTEPRR